MLSRFRMSELSFERIQAAFSRRVSNLPHWMAWQFPFEYTLTNREQLATYKNKHVGKRCFILGNGPSLAKMDLSRLKDEYTFGLNRIYLLFENMSFRPSYYVSINGLVLSQFAEDISELTMPKFLNWDYRKYFDENEDSILYIKPRMSLDDHFIDSPLTPYSTGGTVTYIALQLAYFMGFDKVILIGVDHSFSDQGIPNKVEVREEVVDSNHFHPNYFPKGVRWQLPDLLRSELAYMSAKHAFEADNRRILDATIGGKLEVFPKVDFDSLVP